ncbi:unnamed protein product [marine sediment metagenome]|uniref:Uncharacterized protein n=1 Tax=marine sediment metagenome TaxID=412755 RepID=X1HKC5_9ZZZZ
MLTARSKPVPDACPSVPNIFETTHITPRIAPPINAIFGM